MSILLAKIGVDTARKEAPKVHTKWRVSDRRCTRHVLESNAQVPRDRGHLRHRALGDNQGTQSKYPLTAWRSSKAIFAQYAKYVFMFKLYEYILSKLPNIMNVYTYISLSPSLRNFHVHQRRMML